MSDSRHTLEQAMAFFTGRPVGLLTSGRWPLLRDRLQQCPYSAYEFCWYAALEDDRKSGHWNRLRWHNYMTNTMIWQRFLQWKPSVLNLARNNVLFQNEALSCYLQNGLLAVELLTGNRLDMSSLVRLENALRLQQEHLLDEDELLRLVESRAAAAVELAVGIPE